MIQDSHQRVVVAITGGSGSGYARRLVSVLLTAGCEVHLTLSFAGAQVFLQEMKTELNPHQFDAAVFLGPELNTLNRMQPEWTSQLIYHEQRDFGAGIASGSFKTSGMVICPCSMGTLGAIANGLSQNLTHRAADVHLKEKRKLIVVPRETPLSSIQLENMKRLADAGVVVMPAMPGFYHDPQTIDDLYNFIVVRICDHLGVETRLMKRWGEDSQPIQSQSE